MSRPPYLSPGLERRRRRRRRLPAVLLVLVLLAGGGAAFLTLRDDAAPVAGPPGGNASVLQFENGPVAAPPGPRPLAVDLEPGRDPIRLRFKNQPRSGLLFDLDTGQVLWRHAPERVQPIASVTKMMTALVVVSRAKPTDKVRITKEALAYRGSGVGVLPRGKRVKLETMLNGLLLPSGNDAAIALAQRVSGTTRHFVAAMNQRAHAMGLRCTRFTGVEGLHSGNRSCAVDLAALARAVLDEPRLARIVKRRRAALPFPIKGGRLHLNNNNPLLRMGYPGVIGIKTGYTVKAGRCIVAAASRGGRRLGVVLLDATDTGTQARQLLDRGFTWARRHARAE